MSLSKRLELWLLAALPALLTLLLAVFYIVPKHIGPLSDVMPLLPLMPVFYWGLHKARVMPFWFLFLLGLAMDAPTGMPLGWTSLLAMLFLLLLRSQRRYVHKEGFLVKWGYFAALLLVMQSLGWLLLSWSGGVAAPMLPALIQWALSVACYPPAHVAFDFLEEHIHDRRWHVLHGR